MTNQEKYIQVFGIDAWQQMIVFSGLAEQFKEFWTSPYNEMDCRECGRERVLDKIRTEILAIPISETSDDGSIVIKVEGLKDDVLSIIDRYMEGVQE